MVNVHKNVPIRGVVITVRVSSTTTSEVTTPTEMLSAFQKVGYILFILARTPKHCVYYRWPKKIREVNA